MKSFYVGKRLEYFFSPIFHQNPIFFLLFKRKLEKRSAKQKWYLTPTTSKKPGFKFKSLRMNTSKIFSSFFISFHSFFLLYIFTSLFFYFLLVFLFVTNIQCSAWNCFQPPSTLNIDFWLAIQYYILSVKLRWLQQL